MYSYCGSVVIECATTLKLVLDPPWQLVHLQAFYLQALCPTVNKVTFLWSISFAQTSEHKVDFVVVL